MTVPPRGFDDVTVADMRAAATFKWTETGPGLLGAGAAEMDFGTAPPVTAALRAAVDAEMFGYLTPAVDARTRIACAEWQYDVHGWDVAPDDVRLLPDVVRAFQVAVEHFSPPGSAVVVPTPAYPPFLRVPAMLGRRVVEVPMTVVNGRYTHDLDCLDHTLARDGGLLVLCNPHNPVGRVFDRDELSAICAVVERHGRRVFADEVHAPLVYPGHRHVPYASVSTTAAEHTITATSASKAWNLPGLKCAQMLLSNDADRARWDRLNRLATDGTSTLGAVAATAAYRLGRPWLRALLTHLDRNRRLLADLLGRHLPQVSYTPPEGTFLGWLDCRALTSGDQAPAAHFAARAGVTTLEGADCGRAGTGFARVNFATSRALLTTVVTRLAHAGALAPTQPRQGGHIMYVTSLSAPAAHLVVPAGVTVATAVRNAELPTDGPDAVVVVRDPDSGLRDLTWAPSVEVEVETVTAGTPEGRTVLRHSAALVLAQAVQQLFPEAKLGLGAPTNDGFYYDFELPGSFTAEDLAVLEKEMRQIIAGGQRFVRRVVDSIDGARRELAGEPYKQELLDLRATGDPRVGSAVSAVDVAGVMVVAGDLAIYDNVDEATGERVWRDLSRGPHVASTAAISAVKLLRTEPTRWDGSESRQLQRIHGAAAESAEALDEHLRLLDAAGRRDHRVLGRELDLFTFPDEVGSGLAVFHPKGGAIRREIEAHSRRRHQEDGFEFVYTPHLSHASLIGGTRPLELYRDKIYPTMHLDAESDEGGTVLGRGRDYLLKPMNCPFHNLIYTVRERAHHELPLRMFEMSTIYRYEPVPIRGLTDTRGQTMDDTHIFCTPEQLRDELHTLLASVVEVLGEYGFAELRLVLDTRNDEFFVGTDEQWAETTAALTDAAGATGLTLIEAPAAAQFYGPQVNVHVVDELGRSWKLSTLLVDFNLPELDGLEYTAADGTTQRPMMIHRSLFGSIERFVGLLTEHYVGAFPAWLAPVQVAGVPGGTEQVEYLREVTKPLLDKEVRVTVDRSAAPVAEKVARHAAQLVPFVLVAEATDAAAGTVSVRFRDGNQVDEVPAAAAVAAIDSWLTRRVNASPTEDTAL